jgi:hypothetical protein
MQGGSGTLRHREGGGQPVDHLGQRDTAVGGYGVMTAGGAPIRGTMLNLSGSIGDGSFVPARGTTNSASWRELA